MLLSDLAGVCLVENTSVIKHILIFVEGVFVTTGYRIHFGKRSYGQDNIS